MEKYRKITFEELQKISNTLKYWKDIPIDDICEGVVNFYGNEAVFANLEFCDEYNDEGYDLRLSNIAVFDESGAEIKLNYIENEDYKHKSFDRWHEWGYDLRIGEESYDGGRDMDEFIIDIKKREILTKNREKLPELYIKT